METTSRRVGIGHHVSTRVPCGPGVGGEGKEEQGQSQQMLNSQVRDPPPTTTTLTDMQLCYGRCVMSQEPTRPMQPRSRWGRGWGGVLDRCSAVFYCEREVDASGPSTCLSLSTNAQLSHGRHRVSCEHA